MGREQHFVPQFYLRRFSSDGSTINLLNAARRLIVPKASIKHQSSSRGFYDFSPDLERNLGNLEGGVATILRDIDESGRLPSRNTSAEFMLKYYLLMQRLRTEGTGEVFERLTDYLGKLWVQTHPDFDKHNIDLDKFKIRSNYPVALPMMLMAEHGDVVTEYALHLFQNRTDSDFVTSDNPAVAHNSYCEGVKGVGVLGTKCSGFQILFPISPRALLLMYDADVYKVGRNRGVSVTPIETAAEVRNLNAFQYLNANHNVYFKAIATHDTVMAQFDRVAKLRDGKRVAFVRTERVEKPDGNSSELLVSHQLTLPTRLQLSAVNVRRRKRSVPLYDRPLHQVREQRGSPRQLSQNSLGTVRYPIRDVERR
jgi:hypothetical protein